MSVFHVLTPCFNAESLLAETIESVLAQTAMRAGRAKLNYVILDGASTDGTVEIARRFKHPGLNVRSAPDRGMYDALAAGLRELPPEGICCYINAGDKYAPEAFDVVLELMNRDLGSGPIRWLTGINAIYNENGQVVKMTLPFRYRRRLFECGAYASLLPFVQQEVTFWDASLNSKIDFATLASFRYAGDYYLWHEFSKHATLHVVEAYLGGFRVHEGQLSEQREKYLDEVRRLAHSPGLFDKALAAWDRLLWYAPPRMKKILNRQGLLQYDHKLKHWS